MFILWNVNDAEDYFYAETADMKISKIDLVETKYSYFDTVNCFRVITTEGYTFYIFNGEATLTNIYPAREDESLVECYYKHVGFITEYASNALNQNFLLNFIKDTTVFPILDRQMKEIESEITLEKNASQLSGLVNQIRDCYITLTDYLMNKVRSRNNDFKNDNFKDNLAEFLTYVLPGSQSETRRNVINTIAQKGWKMNAELVHKDSVTVFDIMVSFNILQLVVSSISNIIVGNNMPFNKIKCPRCKGEKHIMQQDSESKDYQYICEDCGCKFAVSLDEIIKKL